MLDRIRAILALLILAAPLAVAVAPAPAAAPSLPAAAPTATPEVVLARVFFATPAELNVLVSRYDAVEYADHDAGFVLLLLSPAEFEALRAAGVRAEVDVARTALLRHPETAFPAQSSGIPNFDCYRTVEETYAAMNDLAAHYPHLATWTDFGDSWEKITPGGLAGYDLRVMVLTNKARPGPKPAFFLMAAIHAREYTPAEQAARFAEYLVTRYGADPDVTWLLDHFEVHIVPYANPDGRKLAEAGQLHRKNTHPANGVVCPVNSWYHIGIDLNRNSSFQWGGVGTDPYECSALYPGAGPASEPETQAVQAYVAALFPDVRGPALTDPAPADASGLFITLHSYGRLVLYPWGATNAPAPNGPELDTLGRKFGFFNRFRVCQSGADGCLYQTSGTTDDWAYGELGVAAYTFEIGDNFFEPCSTFESNLWLPNQAALLYALKAARRPYEAPAGPETLTVTVSAPWVMTGQPLTLTAVADATRYYAGFGAPLAPTQPISAARFSLDAASWVTGTATLPLAAADGAYNADTEAVQVVLDTTGWPTGRRLLFVESQDAAGHWGVPSAVFVTAFPPGGSRHFFPIVSR